MIPTHKDGSEVSKRDFEQIADGLFFIAASSAARKLRTQSVLLAQVDVPVLIAGESGSGKEVAARFIHKLSARSGGKFIKVNCSAITQELLDLELLGCEDASTGFSQPGALELSENGTVLLDEISEMPTQSQFKLLRVLQDQKFLRVGGEVPVRTDVRILATISLDIERALADKKLHEDLYNRLSAFTLHVPSLSERKEEIPLLIDYFMQQLAKLYSLPPRTFTPEMVDACESHIWRGNLRELKSYVKRFLVVGDEELALTELQRGEVGCDSDNPSNSETRAEGQVSNGPGLKSLIQSVKGEAERTAIAAALDRTRWNRKAAAELLKVSYRTLLYKIEQYHMTPPEHPLTFLPSDGARGSRREG